MAFRIVGDNLTQVASYLQLLCFGLKHFNVEVLCKLDNLPNALQSIASIPSQLTHHRKC